MAEKLKVGVCGYGPMARFHAQLLAKQPEVDLVGVGEVQEELRQQAAAELKVPVWPSGEALIDARVADTVFICTPTYLHAPLAIRAMELGHHVFTEKPMALNADECDRMIRTAQTHDRILTVGQVLRFWPEYVLLKNTIASGSLGRLQTLSLLRIGGVTRGWQNWFLDEKRGGTQIFDRHIHDTDLVLWLLGKPEAVQAYGREEEVGGFVHSFTRYFYPDVVVSAEGSADLPSCFPFTMAFTAVFSEGALEYSNRNTPPLKLYRADGKVEEPKLPNPIPDLNTGLNITAAGAYHLEAVYFLDCVRHRRKPAVVTPESARDTVALVRREIQSARGNCRLTVE